MGIIDLSDIVTDPDLAEPYDIVRNNGKFTAQGWVVNATRISNFGVVSIATPKELEAIPEADKVTEVRAFWSAQPLFVTSEDASVTSDTLDYKGTLYRILAQPDYNNRGYWKAMAARIAGQ